MVLPPPIAQDQLLLCEAAALAATFAPPAPTESSTATVA